MSATLIVAVAVGVIGVGSASPDTVRPGALLPPPAYSTLEAARDTVGVVVRQAVGRTGPTIHVDLGRATFHYWYAADSASGWAFRIDVADTSECPYDAVGEGLLARGWTPFWDYGADGPDGSVLGYVTPKYLCVIEGSWDGGDDSDPTYVPAPGCRVTVTCVPRNARDAIR